MSISALLDEIGLRHEVRGDEAVAPCPAHKPDIHPSWSCNLATGRHYCFSCGFGGGLAKLVSRMVGCSYAEAVALVATRGGLADAQRWLESFGTVTETVPRYSEADLGRFGPPPAFELSSRHLTRRAADDYGILWNPGSKSWIIPIRDPETHELWGWQEKNARRFRNRPGGVPKSRALFGLGTVADGSTVVLTESPLDAVRIRSAGFGSGISSYGVRVSNEQLALISSHFGKLILALDNDSAGMAETARICRELKGIPIFLFDYRHARNRKDPGEMDDLELVLGLANARWSVLGC